MEGLQVLKLHSTSPLCDPCLMQPWVCCVTFGRILPIEVPALLSFELLPRRDPDS